MKGVVNFYGKPCAVVDFSLFQDYAELNSKLFLVLKDENDIAFQVSEILDFHNSKNGTIQKIAGASEASSFNSTLSFMGNNGPVNAPILNLNGIISKIRMDLENA